MLELARRSGPLRGPSDAMVPFLGRLAAWAPAPPVAAGPPVPVTAEMFAGLLPGANASGPLPVLHPTSPPAKAIYPIRDKREQVRFIVRVPSSRAACAFGLVKSIRAAVDDLAQTARSELAENAQS